MSTSRADQVRTEPRMPLRVLHLGYADLIPGAPLASYRLHTALSNAEVASEMLVLRKLSNDPAVHGPSGSLRKAWAEWVPKAEVLADRIRNRFPAAVVRHSSSESSLALFGSGLLRQVPNFSPDVIQVHWIAGGVVRLESLRRIAGYPLVWRLPDLWPISGLDHYPMETPIAPPPMIDLDAWLVRRKRASYKRLPNLTLVAPSRWLMRRVQESDLLGDRNIHVIPTGVDLQSFVPIDKNAARQQLGLPLEDRVVLFGAFNGTENPRKGWRELRGALERLTTDPESVRGLHLATFGDIGSNRQRDPWRTTSLGVLRTERDLSIAYSAADLFVAPSLQENLANTVLEALACATPVVAFDVGGMPEAITDGVNGYLATESTADCLARTLTKALSVAPEVRRRQQEAARATAVRCFDLRLQAARYEALYRDLLAANRSEVAEEM